MRVKLWVDPFGNGTLFIPHKSPLMCDPNNHTAVKDLHWLTKAQIDDLERIHPIMVKFPNDPDHGGKSTQTAERCTYYSL